MKLSVWRWLLILGTLCYLSAGLLTINDINIYTPDSSRYLIWAQSLARFDGFVDRTEPEPSHYVVHAPLYPVLLAPVVKISGGSMFAAKVFTLFTGVVCALLIFYVVSLRCSEALAFFASMLFVFNPLTFLFSTELLSDIPFAMFVLLLFILLEDIDRPETISTMKLVSLASVLTICFLLREVGMSLLISTAIFFLQRKDHKKLFFVIAVPLLVYCSWWYRNEIIIARVENPPFTNSELLAEHLFSARDASLLVEYGARIVINAGVYGKSLLSILFFPTYLSATSTLVSALSEPIRSINLVLEYAKYPLWLFSLSISIVGAYRDVTSGITGKSRLVFLFTYLVIICLYPINDSRFLVPVLLLTVFYFAYGCQFLYKNLTRNITIQYIAIPFFVLVSVPNIIWVSQLVSNSYHYNRSPQEFFKALQTHHEVPWHYTKMFKEAGSWIALNSDTESVIAGQWKDITHWIGARKFVGLNQTIYPGSFDATLRDYNVKYLVTLARNDQIQEFEFQIHQSRKFSFRPVWQQGNTIIYEISRNENAQRTTDSSSLFSRGLSLVEEHELDKAEQLFRKISEQFLSSPASQFYLATVLSFSGKWHDADSIFSRIRAYPQSSIFLSQASNQQYLNQLQQQAERSPNANAILCDVARRYWVMGHHAQAKIVLRESLLRDSTFIPSLLLKIYFALREKNIDTAYSLLTQLQQRKKEVRNFEMYKSLIHHLDSAYSSGGEDRNRCLRVSASLCMSLGYFDIATDLLYDAVADRPGDIEAFWQLLEYYVHHNQYYPALIMCKRILQYDKNNGKALKVMASLTRYLEL